MAFKKGEHISRETEFKKDHNSFIKGKTYEEIYGIEKAKQIKERLSKSLIGQSSWCKGLTKETDERVRLKGEQEKGRVSPMKGKHHSEETKLKISLGNKGKKLTEETKNKIKVGNLGKVRSEIVKQQIRESGKGNKNALGHKVSEEARAIMKAKRATQQKTWTTSIEKIMHKKLEENNIKFTPHKYISDILHAYQCDIFIEPNIVIECDGEYYHNYPIGKEVDAIRNVELLLMGYNIIRFWEKDIKNNPNMCLGVIQNQIENPLKIG